MDENALLEARRRWFEEYVHRLDQGVMKPPQEGVRYACPCCGYPTLGERGGYDICELCNWEDDGQDDPHADEVWGGSNGVYSLAEARENFRRYLTMYEPHRETGRRVKPSPAEQKAKRELMAAFDAIMAESDPSTVTSLPEHITGKKNC